MPNGIAGLNGIGKLMGLNKADPELTAAEVHGGPVDPAHSATGEIAEPYPWEAYGGSWGHPQGPLGAENGLLGEPPENETLRAGILRDDPTADRTPYRTHGGPFPKGRATSVGPDAVANQLQQNAALRGTNTGAELSRQYRPTMLAQNDDWTDFVEITPGSSEITTDIDPQLKSGAAPGGWGSHSREQSYARQNQYGFDSRHQHRRWATGRIPGNTMWMNPQGRPMTKTFAGPARPATGPGPFQGQDIGDAFSYDTGAILQDPATEYQPPVVPYVAPAVTADQSAAPGEDWF